MMMNNLSDIIDSSAYEHITLSGDRVYETLKEAAFSGALKSGDVLTEVSVAQLFNVSRTPVREALRRLESEELLVNLPRKGLTVNNIRFSDGVALYDAAIVIEAQSAALAAQNRNATQLLRMEMILAAMEAYKKKLVESEESDKEFAALNYDFHWAIAESSGNKYLFSFVGELRGKMRMMNTALAHKKMMDPTQADHCEEHAAILDAIKKGDSELADLLMKRHLIAAKDFFVNWYSKQR